MEVHVLISVVLRLFGARRKLWENTELTVRRFSHTRNYWTELIG